MKFHIENMTCGGCARGVTRAIKEVDPDANIITDPPTRSVQVSTTASQDEIVSALNRAGFTPAIQ
jgi:copper chaperone